MEVVRGSAWKDAIHLDNLYAAMFGTMQQLGFQSVEKRIVEEDAAFTEVFVGAILYPLLKYFLAERPHAHFVWVYKMFVEPVFVYFMVHENVEYKLDTAKTFLMSRVPVGAGDVYAWALSNYKPFKSRYSKGKTTFLFYPKGTRSARNLERDVYIERLRVVVGMRRALQQRAVVVMPSLAGLVRFVSPPAILSPPPQPPPQPQQVRAVSSPPPPPPPPSPPQVVRRVEDPELMRIEREFLGFLLVDDDGV
jgi:hypothetical protein